MTPAEAMWRLARTVVDPEHLDELPVLAEARCAEAKGRCGHRVATLYGTRLGPVLVAFVPDQDHHLRDLQPKQRRQFAESRDQLLAARSEVDVCDARLAEFNDWHPEIPSVVCWDHGELAFDRHVFVTEGRKTRTPRLVVMVHRRASAQR